MIEWQAGDIAIAKENYSCTCGDHHLKARQTYRVLQVAAFPNGRVGLNVTDPGHWWPHEYFRRETKADKDVFGLAQRSKPKVAQPDLENAE